MAKLLIVDDEILEVEGIKATVDFGKFDISHIFEAYDILQAKEILNIHPIDIMLCDIEMPQGSGLELLEWVREHHPKTECIFLTCHANFNYARKAIQLGSLDYLLKPANSADLEKVIHKALEKIDKERELIKNSKFSKLWFKHQPVLMERFWMDILNQKIPSTLQEIKKVAEEINFPGLEEMMILPILIKVQVLNEKMSLRDEKLMDFALKNVAEEMILKESENGLFIEIDQGTLVAILYFDKYSKPDIDLIKGDCENYILACNKYLSCDLSCYIGNELYAHGLLAEVNQLFVLDKNNVVYNNKVFLLNQQMTATIYDNLPDVNVLSAMLFEGSKIKMMAFMNDYLKDLMNKGELNANILNKLQQDFMQIILSYLKQKGIQAHQLFSDNESVEFFTKAVSSIVNLKIWIEYTIEKAINFVKNVEETQSVVEKAKKYIQQNIDKELTREDIAEQMHFNPDYLSRIFRKETGLFISEYLLQERLKIAKELLSKTDIPITNIAMNLGYSNIPYFSTIFRKYTDMSPADFRKKKL